MSNAPVKLQVLLRREWRTPEGVAKALAILPTLGIKPTVSGQVTLSAEVDADRLGRVFGVADRGAEHSEQGGASESGTLPIPLPLQPLVQSITIAPPHLYLDK